MNLTATTDKTLYTAGETVNVVFTGGYRTGWIRAILYEDLGGGSYRELDRVTGPTETGDDGGFPGLQFPVMLSAPAPATPGVYRWTVTWYGALFDVGNETLNHGEELTLTNSFEVVGGPGCADADGDGFEDALCNPSPGAGGGDCDDTDPLVNPGVAEKCDDGIDNDCDGFVDLLDPDCGAPPIDADGDGFFSDVDCDDTNPLVNPGAAEVCDDLMDNDCDGLTDAADPDCAAPVDEDGDGFFSDVDCNDHDPLINPIATEICGDAVDNDCDGLVDESCEDFDAPVIIEEDLHPFPGQGIVDNFPASVFTTICVRLFDDTAVALADPTCRTAVNAFLVYTDGGVETLEPIAGETRFRMVEDGNARDVWVTFVPDFETTFGSGLPMGQTVQVVVDACDARANSATYFADGSYRFNIEDTAPVLPPQVVEMQDEFVIITLLDGTLSGSFLVVPVTLIPRPFFGPVDGLAPLPFGVRGFAEPVSLQPPMVLPEDCATLVLLLPAGTNPQALEVWRFTVGTGWQRAFVGDGFLVERIDHAAFPDETGQPAVELCVSHLTDGLQLVTPQQVGDDDDDDCFIATAAFGSPMAADVVILRQFRDAYLLSNDIGRIFVRLYYHYSPAIADVIARHEILRAATRTTLMPVIWTCDLALEAPSFVGLGMLLSLTLGTSLVLYRFALRKKRI